MVGNLVINGLNVKYWGGWNGSRGQLRKEKMGSTPFSLPFLAESSQDDKNAQWAMVSIMADWLTDGPFVPKKISWQTLKALNGDWLLDLTESFNSFRFYNTWFFIFWKEILFFSSRLPDQMIRTFEISSNSLFV